MELPFPFPGTVELSQLIVSFLYPQEEILLYSIRLRLHRQRYYYATLYRAVYGFTSRCSDDKMYHRDVQQDLKLYCRAHEHHWKEIHPYLTDGTLTFECSKCLVWKFPWEVLPHSILTMKS